ncbi:MAG: nuclear transport factor 2 family protein [Candidatus Acidiferrales bacterium]
MKTSRMVPIAVVAIASLSVLFAAVVSARSKPTSPEAELRPLIDQLEVFANAHDVDKFMAFYARDPNLIAAFNGTEIRGFEELCRQQAKWWNEGKTDVVYTRRAEPQFTPLAGGGEVVTLFEQSRRTLADGTIANNVAAISLVWEKLPEGWRIVYSHESTEH